MISLSDRIENIVGKGENAGYQHFLLFLQCFQKPSFLGLLKIGLCGRELKYKPFQTKEGFWKQKWEKKENASNQYLYFSHNAFFPI